MDFLLEKKNIWTFLYKVYFLLSIVTPILGVSCALLGTLKRLGCHRGTLVQICPSNSEIHHSSDS